MFAIVCCFASAVTLAGPTSPDFTITPPDAAEVHLETVPANLQTLLSSLVREAIPHEYENKKKWGQQKKTWDGVKLRMDGLKLETKRKWREANHGTWKRYTIEMIDPDESLSVTLTDFRKHEDGTIEFDVKMGSRLKCFGQLQRWNRGVKLLSLSADAKAKVDVQMRCAVNTSMDLSRLPPDVLFHPKVISAQVHLRDLTLDRISHADGPLVKELGDALERVLRKELSDRDEQLVARMNRQIKKKEDKLRLSLHDRLKYGWLKPTEQTAQPEAGDSAE